ncbi:ATP-binding cassette domain-containing protein [Roseisalinus antarcticus]|uniref:Ribose import ATP-binding protein RbsA n=1 Tax=Roseisalinus antarcticus TaxID=254357 RepID=A0A1Y5TJB3_9RHOB|nr:ATP-binding cassette domain-containing protein [Roseisalinus antarcticus]SLN64930.1 Ribose import ATP-binding protein RbsA [Roseisalinus antarcticus]
MTDVLSLSDIHKCFGNVVALKGADLSVGEGEVVALLGDNGAGKSTLIKIVSGVIEPDRGSIAVNGSPVRIRSARDAMALGIETIHQDTSLAPHLSIGRNLFLGREPVRLPWLGPLAPIDFGQLRDAAASLLRRVGITKSLTAQTPVNALSGGERQSIAISRAMQFAARLIILDEPTNNLGVEETRGVLRFVGEMKAQGHSVLLITHNVHHVLQVADRLVVMRRGEVVAQQAVAGAGVLDIEGLIMGVDLTAEEPALA